DPVAGDQGDPMRHGRRLADPSNPQTPTESRSYCAVEGLVICREGGRTMRRRALVVLVVTLGLSAGALVGAGQAVTTSNRSAGVRAEVPVSITEFMFTPSRLMVHVGDTVTWTNN